MGAVTTEVGIPNLIWTWRGCQASLAQFKQGHSFYYQSTPEHSEIWFMTGPLPSPWGEEHWPKCSDAPWSTGECLLPCLARFMGEGGGEHTSFPTMKHQ